MWAIDETMLHRIVMHIIKMPFEILFRFYSMFPESRLPDSTTAFPFSGRRDARLLIACGQPSFCKFFLDP